MKKKVAPKKKQKASVVTPTPAYMGVIISALVVLFFIPFIDTSRVKGDSTSIYETSNSIGTTVSSLFSRLFKKNTTSGTATAQTTLSTNQLLSMADNSYADGNLPLGDNKYVTNAPKKGYIYLCTTNSNENGGGADTAGNWIHGNTWNIKEKLSVNGYVSWPQAKFSTTVSGDTRTLSGNNLPTTHTTGIFPVQSTDPAYTYDKNPNTIKAQTLAKNLPVTPTYSASAYCVGGEVGVMLSGVALFNGFDALHRDAAAHEVQDGCQGHPQVSGEYHYHSLSSCINDIGIGTVIGYALDGFPITGSKVATDKYLTTDDLDECHGITSEITVDGIKKTMYHYVMTKDFPYSVSCFRGKPVSLTLIEESTTGGMQQKLQRPSTQPEQMRKNQNTPTNTQQRMQPPQEAVHACAGQSAGASCQFTSPRGTITGICKTPPGRDMTICVPANQK